MIGESCCNTHLANHGKYNERIEAGRNRLSSQIVMRRETSSSFEAESDGLAFGHRNHLQPTLPILKNENESEIGLSNSNNDRTLETASVHN